MGIEVVVIRVVTRCTSEDELVATFSKLSTDSSLFIPTRAMRSAGVETGFSIRLADGTPMLRGLCVVLGSYADRDNAFGRPGVHLGIRALTPDSQPVFARLRDPMLPLLGNETVRLSEDEARPTVEMAPLLPDAVDCEVTDDPTDAIATESDTRTILGMPPLVPPRKDTVRMTPIERAALLAPAVVTGAAMVGVPVGGPIGVPIGVIDEDAVPIRLPLWARLRGHLARMWRRLSPPQASRAPQAR